MMKRRLAGFIGSALSSFGNCQKPRRSGCVVEDNAQSLAQAAGDTTHPMAHACPHHGAGALHRPLIRWKQNEGTLGNIDHRADCLLPRAIFNQQELAAGEINARLT
jgi:hypothetical protein